MIMFFLTKGMVFLKKLKKFCLIFIIFSIICGTNVSAASIDGDTFVPDYENKSIKIEGNLDYEGDASVYITYESASTHKYELDSVYQIETEADKSFVFEKELNNCSCNIKMYVSGSDTGEQTASYEFYFPSAKEYSDAIGSFTSLSDIQDLFAVENGALKNKNILDILFGTDIVDDYSKILKHNDLICKLLYDEIDSKEYTYKDDSDEIKEIFSQLCAINSIPGASNANVKAAIEKPAVKISESGLYTVYNYTCFTDSFENDIFEKLSASTSFSSIENFYKAFNDAVTLSAVKNFQTGAYLNLTPVLKKAKAAGVSLSDIDFTGYEALGTKKGKVDKLVANNTYTSISSLVTAYNDAVTTIKNSLSGGSGGGGGAVVAVRDSEDMFYTDDSLVTDDKFDLADVPEIELTDLNSAPWAEKEIEYLLSKNIVSGYSDGRFNPNASITRAEFLKILICALDFDMTENYKIDFEDVNKTDWYYRHVAVAYGNGITTGADDKNFAPDKEISRAEIVTMIYRALEVVGFNSFEDKDIDFTDSENIPEWAYDAVKAVCGLEIVKGFEDGSFKASENATRAQAAVMTYRTLESLEY